nr:MAG TPA: hypothetical protein [Caudoviricetes sp.]
MDKARLFRRAHKMTKVAIAKFGGNYMKLTRVLNRLFLSARGIRNRHGYKINQIR